MYQLEIKEIWNPCENLFSKYRQANYAVVILNTSLKFPPNILKNLWNQAKIRITVDGGTQRWLSWMRFNNIDFSQVCDPDLITGDMDSLSKDILQYFVTNTLSTVVKTPDQNETDFTKALRELDKFCSSKDINIETVYVICESSGRFDQIMANINTLYKAHNIVKHMKVFQLASNSLTWLLKKGNHTIHIPQLLRQNQEWCALIPLNAPGYVTTSGLKWNLDTLKMEFGGIVSTSNTYDGNSSIVRVYTENTIIWSMGIESLIEAEL